MWSRCLDEMLGLLMIAPKRQVRLWEFGPNSLQSAAETALGVFLALRAE